MELIPFVGVCKFRLGMSAEQIQDAAGINGEYFQKSDDSKSEVLSMDEIGAHFSFDKIGQCEAIELFAPAHVSFSVVDLLPNHLTKLVKELAGIGVKGDFDDNGVDFRHHGFGIYCPGIDDDAEAKVEAIIVYGRSYSD